MQDEGFIRFTVHLPVSLNKRLVEATGHRGKTAFVIEAIRDRLDQEVEEREGKVHTEAAR